jgi:uncharacterized protein (TIGR02328 family)
MRLWHKDLIEVLPRQQLLSQWRELCSIFVKENRHILINFLWDKYPLEHLLSYTYIIIEEFNKRGYNISEDSMNKMILFFKKYNVINSDIKYVELFKNKMNKTYLRQCIYNLEEKAICGGITEFEWKKIYDKYKYDFELWGEINE